MKWEKMSCSVRGLVVVGFDDDLVDWGDGDDVVDDGPTPLPIPLLPLPSSSINASLPSHNLRYGPLVSNVFGFNDGDCLEYKPRKGKRGKPLIMGKVTSPMVKWRFVTESFKNGTYGGMGGVDPVVVAVDLVVEVMGRIMVGYCVVLNCFT